MEEHKVQRQQEGSEQGMEMDNFVEAAVEVAPVLATAFHQVSAQLLIVGQMDMAAQQIRNQ